uniref:Pentraxin (PTX) domain-containing protein n=1 Tax=Neogobius melanostomus TaxID=47308 RepID=A0A8C6SAE7_9GOBI
MLQERRKLFFCGVLTVGIEGCMKKVWTRLIWNDFVELEPLKPLDLSSFTLCLRVATELPRRQREIILFAYRTFCLVKPRVSSLLRIGLYLRSSSEGALFTVPALGPMQTHLCVTWDSGTGATTAFVDGKKSLTKFYGKGHTVNSGGKVIIGQDPDEYLGSFEASQSFVGEISDINLWSSVLPHSVIQQMATRLSSTQPGDIIDWKEVKMQVTGDVKLITTNEQSSNMCYIVNLWIYRQLKIAYSRYNLAAVQAGCRSDKGS